RPIGRIPDPLGAILRKTDLYDWREAILGDLDAVRIVAVEHYHAILRHDIDQPTEAQFYRREILENVGVVELDVVDHEQFRQVVDELRALVEKGAGILVALDHKMLRVVKERALAEIARQTADDITRLQFAHGQHPGQERACSRLPVRAGDNEIMPTAQEKFLQDLREREVVELLIQNGFDLRIAPFDRVADHDDLRVVRQIFRTV